MSTSIEKSEAMKIKGCRYGHGCNRARKGKCMYRHPMKEACEHGDGSCFYQKEGNCSFYHSDMKGWEAKNFDGVVWFVYTACYAIREQIREKQGRTVTEEYEALGKAAREGSRTCEGKAAREVESGGQAKCPDGYLCQKKMGDGEGECPLKHPHRFNCRHGDDCRYRQEGKCGFLHPCQKPDRWERNGRNGRNVRNGLAGRQLGQGTDADPKFPPGLSIPSDDGEPPVYGSLADAKADARTDAHGGFCVDAAA